jgi:hypothetical protein
MTIGRLYFYVVVPAEAGIQWLCPLTTLGPRLRGDDDTKDCEWIPA